MKSLSFRVIAASLAVLAAACSYDATYPVPEPVAPKPAAKVDVLFCSFAAPKWVGVQDGGGEWKAVAPETRGTLTTYHLTLTSDHGAIAVARGFASGLSTLAINFGTPAELAAAGDGTAADCAESFDLTLVGSVFGLDTNEAATISVDAHAFDFVSPLHGSDFKLESVASGPHDVLAARFSHVANTTKLTGVILRHGVTAAAGPMPDLDFTSSEAFLTVTRRLDLIGPSGVTSHVYGLRTARGGDRVLSQTSVVGGPVQLLTSAPEEALGPSDLQFVVATTAPINGTNIVRSVKTYFRIPADRSLAFGPVPDAPEISVVAKAPTLQLSAHFRAQAGYERAAAINFQQGQSTIVSLAMTDAYARLVGGYQLLLPDLSGVAGFDSRWTLDAIQPVLWTSTRLGGTLGLGVNAVPTEGTIVRIATDAGNVIKPAVTSSRRAP